MTFERPLGPIDTYLFDHDGTLVDSLPVVVEASNDVLRVRGLAPAPPETIIRGMVHPTAPRLGLLAGLADPGTQEALARHYNERALAHAGLATLYPGVEPLLQTLKARGARLGVVSNSSGAFIRTILGRLGVAPLFATLTGEEDMPAPKPDPRGLLGALGGHSWDRAVYIGDSSADLKAARAAGLRVVGVTWGTHSRAELEPMGFDRLIDSPEELAAL